MTVAQMHFDSSFQESDSPKEEAERSESTNMSSNLDPATMENLGMGLTEKTEAP